ncbi:MAG: SAM-dependent methyltransferase [Caldibacillus debilis]|uniref:SAM-dependent methyltransferase n=1 Tax=Caldibacillus debilis TaxID=301148 RepID=A0A3E0K240_9BACI|nr:class I SAM-dependent methyltransferase [Caldibacillus debilis]REJ27182.1 MAG: SAM-dependent methyltransferase [Caldibacillus debilis]
MIYRHFAQVYDLVMDEAPYGDWIDFFLRKQKKYCPHGKKVLDLACGTGTVTMMLHERGFEVAGADLSEEMLAVAAEKSLEKGYRIPFFAQDMTAMEDIGRFDIVVIFCDSLNYLREKGDVAKAFANVRRLLNDGGLFLFDVHSLYKVNRWYPGKTFAYNGEEVSYIWNCFQGVEENSVEHELTFFVRDGEGELYGRFDEIHLQRTFPPSEYGRMLEEAGFVVLDMEGDFGGEVKEESERIFFTAKREG